MNIKSKAILRVLVILFLANIVGGSCLVRAQTRRKTPPRHTVAANNVMRLRLNGLSSKILNQHLVLPEYKGNQVSLV